MHRWTPCHREPLKRSHVDKAIVLLQIGERFVPIVESAVKYIKEDEVIAEEVDKKGDTIETSGESKGDNFVSENNEKIEEMNVSSEQTENPKQQLESSM